MFRYVFFRDDAAFVYSRIRGGETEKEREDQGVLFSVQENELLFEVCFSQTSPDSQPTLQLKEKMDSLKRMEKRRKKGKKNRGTTRVICFPRPGPRPARRGPEPKRRLPQRPARRRGAPGLPAARGRDVPARKVPWPHSSNCKFSGKFGNYNMKFQPSKFPSSRPNSKFPKARCLLYRSQILQVNTKY